jgi:hypothetical protein
MMRWHDERLSMWTHHVAYYIIVCILLALIAKEGGPWLAWQYANVR